MENLIDGLDNLGMDLRNMIEYLREVEMLSREARSLKVDVMVYGAMSARAIENLSGLLEGVELAKLEVKEVVEEVESGEVPGEPVQEPADSPPSGEASIQEPQAEAPEGD